MKLSLTFEPFVKPQYKEFCVNKIQQTVAEIKHHFKFSLKEHIYQDGAHQTNAENVSNCKKPTVKDRAGNDVLNKTVKKETLKRATQHSQQDENLLSTSQNIKFFHLLQNKQFPSKSSSLNHLQQPSQQLIQQQELVGFLQKVESALGNHTNFYQDMMEKIQFMNRKQLHLEKIIQELKAIQKEKSKTKNTSSILQDQDRPQLFNNLDYMTFRDHQFVKGEKDHEITKDSLRSISKKTTAKFQSDLEQDFKPSNKQKPKQFFSAKSSSRNNPAIQKQPIYDQNSEEKNGEGVDLDGISQNADFLISFMKLEQQFNKLKRKSQFKNSQDSPKSFKKSFYGNNLQQSSRIQLNYAH